MFQQYIAHKENFAARSQDVERTLYRLAQVNLIDDMCAHGFNRSHTDLACKFKKTQKTIHVISIYLIYLSLSLWSWLSFLLQSN
jgi:hypothetical protein